MPGSRLTGLLLLVVGMSTFAGTTNEMLPAVAFWPAAVVCCFGIVIFMKANRVAIEQAEAHARQQLTPPRLNTRLEQIADGQLRASGAPRPGPVGQRENPSPVEPARAEQAGDEEIVLYDVDEAEAGAGDQDFVVSTDVSFPLHLQQRAALADQLEKLKRLLDQGIISAEEFAVAKAKLLS